MKYLIFGNAENFENWNNQVNLALGYPNEETKTYFYTSLLDTVDGALICPVDETCPAEFLEGKTLYEYTDIQPHLINIYPENIYI